MVQIKAYASSSSRPADEERFSDEYWKLDPTEHLRSDEGRDAMAERKFRCPRGTKEDRIMTLFRRIDRGLMLYERCSLPELQRFIRDRNITIPVCDLKSKKVMIIALEKADDNRTFDKFMDLPPELRASHLRGIFRRLRCSTMS